LTWPNKDAAFSREENNVPFIRPRRACGVWLALVFDRRKSKIAPFSSHLYVAIHHGSSTGVGPLTRPVIKKWALRNFVGICKGQNENNSSGKTLSLRSEV